MAPKAHTKHAKLPRPAIGEWSRNELALLGTTCSAIRELVTGIAQGLSGKWKIAYADASHDEATEAASQMTYLDRGSEKQLAFPDGVADFERRSFFNSQDLVLVNGNHFKAAAQIIIIDEAKPLTQKLDRLTHVVLILTKHPHTALPDYLKLAIPAWADIPMLPADDQPAITAFIDAYLQSRVAPVKGLVLAGGQSIRMGRDKGLLRYHGDTQRAHVYHLLEPFCIDVFLSCNAAQYPEAASGALNALEDRFTGIGPMGGILTAMQSDPDAAWLAVACDLPFLNREALGYLVQHRNPAKFATAFYNEQEGFPEPMVALWEPRSYPLLLQWLARGYSCPRKALINAPIELVQLPDQLFLKNINEPQGYEETLKKLPHA